MRPYATIARVTAADYTDTNVTEGATYWYRVQSVDTSFNRSAPTAPVAAVAKVRNPRRSWSTSPAAGAEERR